MKQLNILCTCGEYITNLHKLKEHYHLCKFDLNRLVNVGLLTENEKNMIVGNQSDNNQDDVSKLISFSR